MSRADLTPLHKENFEKTAVLLEGPLKAEFDMSQFCEFDSNGRALETVVTDCGTVGCVLGHAIGVVPKFNNENFWQYAERAFGCHSEDLEYHWVFHPSWKHLDNTAKGAAKRIRVMLEKGIPETFDIGVLLTEANKRQEILENV